MKKKKPQFKRALTFKNGETNLAAQDNKQEAAVIKERSNNNCCDQSIMMEDGSNNKPRYKDQEKRLGA